MELKIFEGARPKIVHNKYERVFSRIIEMLEKKIHINIIVEVAQWLVKYPKTFKITIICKFDTRYWDVRNPDERSYIYIDTNSKAKRSLYKILTEWLRGGYDIGGRYTATGDDTIFAFNMLVGSLWTCLCHGKTPTEWLIQLDLGTTEWYQIY